MYIIKLIGYKAKKKLILLHEDSFIGIKNIFHSMRILDFRIQIATNKFIINFLSINFLWEKFNNEKDSMIADVVDEDSWKDFINDIKPEYNRLHSELKKLLQNKG